MKKHFSSLILLIVVLFTGCVSHPQFDADIEPLLYPSEAYVPETFDWQEVVPGISRFDFENKEFPVIYHVVRVELDTPGLQLVCFPDKAFVQNKVDLKAGEKIPQPFIYRGITTKKFAKKYGCTVAVNATPFGGRNGKWDLIAHVTSTRQLVGVHIDESLEIATPVSAYAALKFSRNENGYIASIIDSQLPDSLQDCDYAFGGFFTVLRDGNIIDFSYRSHDSRTGCGISKDGRVLYIMVAEGEYLARSEGMSFSQCAEVFKAMGCDDALEFDGGGSTQLCINGETILTYNKGRVQGNSFGFVIK